MKRPRPYIPLPVRVQVVERMLAERFGDGLITNLSAPLSQRISSGLEFLDFEEPQLDHDPALILREFNEETGKYTPDANDPAYLIYREQGDHLQKTTGRKPGALKTITTKGSDIGLKTKFARLERKGKRRKQRIPSRQFPKQKRSFQ